MNGRRENALHKRLENEGWEGSDGSQRILASAHRQMRRLAGENDHVLQRPCDFDETKEYLIETLANTAQIEMVRRTNDSPTVDHDGMDGTLTVH